MDDPVKLAEDHYKEVLREEIAAQAASSRRLADAQAWIVEAKRQAAEG